MPLFTGPQPDPLAANPHPAMQTALLAARQALSLTGALNVDQLALMVVCLTGFAGTNNHPWASIRDTEEHYSASLLKVTPRCVCARCRKSVTHTFVKWPAMTTKSTGFHQCVAHIANPGIAVLTLSMRIVGASWNPTRLAIYSPRAATATSRKWNAS